MGLTQAQVDQLRAEQPFTYQATILFADNAAVGASGADTPVQILDVDFVCTSLVVFSRNQDTGILVTAGDVGAAGNTNVASDIDPAVLIQIEESGANRSWFQVPVDAALFARPAALPRPRLMRRATSFVVRCTLQRDVTTATDSITTRVLFHGFHVY